MQQSFLFRRRIRAQVQRVEVRVNHNNTTMSVYFGKFLLSLLLLSGLFELGNAFATSRAFRVHRQGQTRNLQSVQMSSAEMQSMPAISPLLTSYSDEEDDDQAQQALATVIEADMSVIKEGIKPLCNVNGSDVRVGIIMARWNADVITGLYKVKTRHFSSY